MGILNEGGVGMSLLMQQAMMMLTGGGPQPSSYYEAMMATAPDLYWRLGDTSATMADDSGNGRIGTLTGGYTQGQPSLVNDANAATSFNGSSGMGYSNAAVPYSASGTVTAVIKTASSQGGTVAGFANTQQGTASNYDRFSYVDSAGKYRASTYLGGRVSMTSTTSVNDGLAHRLAFTWGPSGGSIYVDGNHEANEPSFTGGDVAARFLRIAQIDFGSGYPATPASFWLAGVIDEVTYHARVLSDAELAALNAAAL